MRAATVASWFFYPPPLTPSHLLPPCFSLGGSGGSNMVVVELLFGRERRGGALDAVKGASSMTAAAPTTAITCGRVEVVMAIWRSGCSLCSGGGRQRWS
jgi:hypothetical protein